MKTRGLLLIVCIVAVWSQGFATIGTWKNFTSMKEVRGLTREGNTYWTATSGGLFGWNAGKNSYQLFTNAEGLQSTDLTAVGIDKARNIWTGTSTGRIHVYSQEGGTWRYIVDIDSSNHTNKRINSFTMQGDTVLVCTEFGLSVFRLGRFEFGDTYSQFGSLRGNIRVSVLSAVVFSDSFWLAVSDGQNVSRVAVASLSTPNLLPPESWNLLTVGGISVVPKQLVVFDNKLYAGTSAGLYIYASGSWDPVPSLSGQNIVALNASASILSVTTASQAFTVDLQQSVQQVGGALPFLATSITSSTTGQPVIGSTDGGLLSYDTSWTAHLPDGPNSNSFSNIAVDIDGTVWGASGLSNGKGFYRYNGRNWKSFTMANSGLPTNDYYRVSTGCNGSVWVSSWGSGVLEIPYGFDRVDTSHIYGKNKGMVGIGTDGSYIVITTVLCDSRGNHWMAITRAGESKILAVQKPDDTWITMQAVFGSIAISTLIDCCPVDRTFAVDAYDNIWGVARSGNMQGVFSLGNGGAVNGSVKYFLTTTDGLPSNEVTTVVVDHDNTVWVGTDHGIAIILDPLNPKRSGGIASYVPLRGTAVNCIAVDAINQKWIGTSEGVYVYSPDGTQPIASYTVASTNGKLIDNDVKSIAIDGNTGTVYFGTLSGLASLATVAVTPKSSFDKLQIFPNPFLIPNNSQVLIDGLVENSTLKILSIDGNLVRQIKSPGGRIGFWDGKDEQGQFVSSGVYLVIASSDKDEEVAKGKIAVIRR